VVGQQVPRRRSMRRLRALAPIEFGEDGVDGEHRIGGGEVLHDPSSSSSDAARSRPSEPASAATSSSPIRSTNNCSMAVARVPPTPPAGRAAAARAPRGSRAGRRSAWPRTVKPIPARVNASSMAGSWAFRSDKNGGLRRGHAGGTDSPNPGHEPRGLPPRPSVKRWTAPARPRGLRAVNGPTRSPGHQPVGELQDLRGSSGSSPQAWTVRAPGCLAPRSEQEARRCPGKGY